MYQPNYKITDKILNSIVKIERIRTEAAHVELSYDLRSKLSQQTKAENLFHLGHMLNMNFTLKEATKVAEGRKLEEESERANLIYNFRNILEFNRSGVANELVNMDVNSMLQMNGALLANWKEPSDVRYRNVEESLDGKFEDWINYRLSSLTDEELNYGMREILDWFQTESTRINELVRLAILILRWVELMPFWAGNKYTLLAQMDLMMYRYGYLQHTYFPLLKTFDQHEKEFWQIWDMCQRNHELTLWVEKFVETFAKDLETSFGEVKQAIGEQTQKNTSQPFLDLNKRQLKILRYLQNIPTVQREDYCQMMDVSTMTAYRDLNDLVDKKLLKVDGQGRGTRYMLSTR